MKTEALRAIGIVRKTHGYEGELKLALDEEFRESLAGVDFLFIGEGPETAIPYRVASKRGADDIVRLDGVDTKEAAEALRGCPVFARAAEVSGGGVTPTSLIRDHDAAKAFRRFVGFAVIDEAAGEIGAIVAIEAYPGQTLATVDLEGERRLVPLTADLIRGVDFTKKIVFMNLPEGLLEI